jgi:uncharacterized protein
MASAASVDPSPGPAPIPVKIVIAGGFGAGKTTTVASASEFEPLTTEAAMTELGAGVDDAGLLPDKRTTTVAMDFGRITLAADLRLYLFGTPGQDRFGFMWDDLARGALGALVVVDGRRLDDCFPSLDFVESRSIPFVVAVNRFDGDLARDLAAVTWALAVPDGVRVVAFDARDRRSVVKALIDVAEVALRRAEAGVGAGPPGGVAEGSAGP